MVLTERKNKNFFILFLSIYLFLMPFDFYPLIEGVSVSRFLVFLPLLGALFEMRSFKIFKGESFWVLGYFATVSLTYFYSVDKSSTKGRIISLFLNFVVIILFSMRSYSRDEIEKLFKSVAFSGWLFFALTLLYGKFQEGRLFVVIDNLQQDPNYFCGFFIFSICYYLWRFLENNKILCLIFSMILSVPIFLTGSRGGLLALLGSVFVIFVVYIRRGDNRRFVKFFFSALVVFLAVLIFWRYLPENIINRFTLEYTLEDNGAGRFEIWEDIIEKFKDADLWNKVFGYGAATVSNFNSHQNVAHNIYIETLIEMGVVGTVMIFLMYFKYGIMALKLKDGFLVAVYAGYMIMTLSMSLYSYKPIWNIILLIVIVTVYEKNKTLDEEFENIRRS